MRGPGTPRPRHAAAADPPAPTDSPHRRWPPDSQRLRIAPAALQREAKQRGESIGDQYRKGGPRNTSWRRSRPELTIIEAYLPDQLGEDELRAIARELIEERGASGPGDLGAVMGPLMQRVRGRADGRQANAIVRELLSGA